MPTPRTKPKDALKGFLPCVQSWFRETFAAPSPAQVAAWPTIRKHENTLLLAPTGSGKTLSAFMCAINDLMVQAEQGALQDGVQVLYITPLKALGNDIHKNLLDPLAGIRAKADKNLPEIKVAVRTGDTTSNERAQMIRKPPHILITTPESLFLLIGSKRMSPNLRSVKTVIVDEIHAMCDNKRGVHLSISLERLEELVDAPYQRVGCSATLSPIEEIAAFLVGAEDHEQRPCTIVDAGMRKDLDVRVMAPLPDFLEAGNTALWASAYELLLREIAKHDTTLVFVNSRYKAERTSVRIAELDDEHDSSIGVHHGSMSKEMRLEAEDKLKAGQLDALIATASLELGIDIGSVDLVYQLESPKTMATALQRIGRAGHLLDATSKGRVLVFERDELMEAAAIARSMMKGEMDSIVMPRGCLDVLAQQIVGIVSTDNWHADELLALLRRAHPFTDLTDGDYELTLSMLAGDHTFDMARPPLPLIHWDRTTGRLAAARGSKQISNMCVGTISERSEYDIVIERDSRKVGTVGSEFVDDSLRVGDVFVLGSSNWKVQGISKNRLLVDEAPGATPTVPWWHGPIPPRSSEVGTRVGELRREIASHLSDPDALQWLQDEYCLCPFGAGALLDYVREQEAVAGVVPDHETFLVETWRDEMGRPSVIIHTPLGRRINQTWGEAIAGAAKENYNQRWSVTASNDLILLMRQKDVSREFSGVTAEDLLGEVSRRNLDDLIDGSLQRNVSAGSAFREAAVCALQVPRARRGQRVPVWLQNHFSNELFEAAGAADDYPVVKEVRRGHREEALDVDGLRKLLRRLDTKEIQLVFKEVDSPSPFSHSLLVNDLYSDDHQMGRGRRAQLLRMHRQVLSEVLSTEEMAQLLDQRAIDKLERRRQHQSENTVAQTVDELGKVLHDLGDVPAHLGAIEAIVDEDPLVLLGPLLEEQRVVAIELAERDASSTRLVPADLWRQYYDAFRIGEGAKRPTVLLPQIDGGMIAGYEREPVSKVIPAKWRKKQDQHEARYAVVERYLQTHGPTTLYELINYTGWAAGTVQTILTRLVEDGKVAEGVYSSQKPRPQWVNKANLEEIHRLTMSYLKRELAACAPYEAVDFMTRWQHYHPDSRLQGIEGLRAVIEQLQGFEVITGALESEVLATRVRDYRPEMLERLIAAGEVSWRRVGGDRIQRGKVTLCLRRDGEWLAGSIPVKINGETDADVDMPETTRIVRDYFRTHRTAFFDDVLEDTECDAGEVLRAVWHLAWCGELTCDTYECLRYSDFQVSVSACYDLGTNPRKIVRGVTPASSVIEHMEKRGLDARLGRWAATERLTPPKNPMTDEERAARWAQQLLRRWGIISRDFLQAEVAAPKWGAMKREFKRLELLGEVSRGYFIEGLRGEQYGLPEAIELLRDCRARRSDGRELGYIPDEPVFWISSRDPANLYASCLDVIDERGEKLERRARRGNMVHRVLLQAGQTLIYQTTQLVTLTKRQLIRCIEKLRSDVSGKRVPIQWREWNGHPIDASPIAGVLLDLGFGFNGRRELLSPPPRRPAQADVPDVQVDMFPPYFASPLIEYGPTWTVERAPRELQPALVAVFEVLADEILNRPNWETTWHNGGPECKYRNSARIGFYIARSFADVQFFTRTLRYADGKRRSLKPWNAKLRVTTAADVNRDFIAKFRDFIGAAESITDRILDRKSEEEQIQEDYEKTIEEIEMSENCVLINRAPVFTLWGTVVAERLGFNREEALSLAKIMAGLTAQKKGRMLGIYKPGEMKRNKIPKKVGLGEDFWIQLCDRPIPAKETPDGIRGVNRDKPAEPEKVVKYLSGKFGEDLARVEEAMAYVADSFTPDELELVSYELYEKFRPEIPRGQKGWGAKGKLDLDFIRSLAKEE